jgi:hypothetical protein
MLSFRNVLVIVAAVGLLTSSCKKKKSETFEALLGTWKMKTTVIDKNNNGQIDADEVTKWDLPVPGHTILFKRSRNGFYSAVYFNANGGVVANNTEFLFSLNNDDLEITNTNATGIFPDGVRHITSINYEELILKEPANAAGITWTTYTRM